MSEKLIRALDEAAGKGRWLTWDAAAEALGIDRKSVQRRAQRGHWQRQDANDGATLVLVPAEALGLGDTEADTSPDPSPRGLPALVAELGRMSEDLRQAHAKAERLAAELADARLALERVTSATAEPVSLRQPPPPGYRLERLGRKHNPSFRFVSPEGAIGEGFTSAWSVWRAAHAHAKRRQDGAPGTRS